jgi:hypothetical protein
MMGIDALGLAHRLYKVETLIQTVPKEFAIGAFDHVFGDVLPKIKKLISSGYRTFRIQLWWGGSKHVIAPLNHTEAMAKKWERVAKAFPNCTFYLSHSCEYDESKKPEVIKRVQILKKFAPSCIPVDSVYKGATSGLAIVERHGDVTVKPGEITSTDGDNLYDLDANSWRIRNEKAALCFGWGYRFNLREINDPDQKVPPISERTASPSAQYTASVVRLLVPKFTINQDIKKPECWKSHAEDDQEDDPHEPDEKRENRPVFLSKESAQVARIYASNGQLIGELAKFGAPLGNCHRYYSGVAGGIGLYGYEIGIKAKQISGSEIISIKVGNKVYKDINPAFREGYWR